MCILREFKFFLKRILQKVKENGITSSVSKDSCIVAVFLIQNIFIKGSFKINEKWIENLTSFASEKICDEDLQLATCAESCDEFITFFRNICHYSGENDLIEHVSFLFSNFLKNEYTTKIKVNFSWIAGEIFNELPFINNCFKSIRRKFRNQKTLDAFPQLFEIIQKSGSIQNLALSLKSKKKKKWTKFNSTHLWMSAKAIRNYNSLEMITIDAIVTLKLLHEIIGTNYSIFSQGGGGKRKKNQLASKITTSCLLTDKDFEILKKCSQLVQDNYETYKWIIDENKMFFDMNLSSTNFETLSNLDFGSVANLKKNGKRSLGYMRSVNELLAKKESQQFLKSSMQGKFDLPEEFDMKINEKEPLPNTDSLSSITMKETVIFVKDDLLIEEKMEVDTNENDSVEEIFKAPSKSKRKGLKNINSSSCYFSSVLQVLFNIEEFCEALIRYVSTDNLWIKSLKMLYRVTKNDDFKGTTTDAITEECFKDILNESDMEGFKRNNGQPIQGCASEFLEILINKLPYEFKHIFDVNNVKFNSVVTEIPLSNFPKIDDPKNFNDIVLSKLIENVEDKDIPSPLPNFLVIGCPRFGGLNLNEIGVQKDLTEIEIPKELNINNEIFKLSSIIKHIGPNSNSGHYIAYCLREINSNVFTKYDDESVKDISLKKTLRSTSTQCRLLIYQKYDPNLQQCTEIGNKGSDSSGEESLFESRELQLNASTEYELYDTRRGLKNVNEISSFFNTTLQLLFNIKEFENALKLCEIIDNSLLNDLKKLHTLATSKRSGTVNMKNYFKNIANHSKLKNFDGCISNFLDTLIDELPAKEFRSMFNVRNIDSVITPLEAFDFTESGIVDFSDQYKFDEKLLKKILGSAQAENASFTFPNSLIIQCKRNINDEKARSIQPIINLKNETYELNGIARKIRDGNHYIAYCKLDSDEFVEYDDENITIMSTDKVMKLISREFVLLIYCKYSKADYQHIQNHKRLREIDSNTSLLMHQKKISRKTDMNENLFKKRSKKEQQKISSRAWQRSDKLSNIEKYKLLSEKRRLQMAEARLDEEFNNKDRKRSIKQKQKDRLDPILSAKDNKRRSGQMKKKLEDEIEKNKHKKILLENLRKRNENSKAKKEYNKQRKEQNRIKMLDDNLRHRHNLMKDYGRYKKHTPQGKYLELLKIISQVPSQVCSCCQRLNFECKMHKTIKSHEKAYEVFNKKFKKERGEDCGMNKFMEDCIALRNKTTFCGACVKNFYMGKVPPYAPLTGIKLNPIPKQVSDLSELEEILISPVLPFMQIQDMKPYAKFTESGAKGPVININLNVPDTVSVLPRRPSNSRVIQIKLKRHLLHKRAYKFETIRPKKIYEALEVLRNTPLYKHIAIDDILRGSYWDKSQTGFTKFFTDKDDAKDVDSESEDEKELKTLEDIEKAEELYNNINKDFGIEGAEQDVLVYQMPFGLTNQNYTETLNVDKKCLDQVEEKVKKKDEKNQIEQVDNPELSSLFDEKNDKFKLIEMAPGQGKTPQLADQIPFYEEKANPRAHAGYALNYDRNAISIVKRYKHQLALCDRRFAGPKMALFLAKRKLEYQLANCIRTALRKCKKGKKLTAKDVLDPEKLLKMCNDDEAYRFMQSITITPGYLEKSKKKAMAVVRQLGNPSFFLTLSPKEHHWTELLMEIYKLMHGKKITEQEMMKLSDIEKSELIRSEPYLVTQFFNNRIDAIMKHLTEQSNLIFGENIVVDFIRRREYQMRGAPHEHIILYCKDVLSYSREMPEEMNKKLMQFIDSVITCENKKTTENPNVFFQYHVCTMTCWKKNKANDKKCRFRFPRFPMIETKILQPLKGDNDYVKRAEKNFERIRQQLLKYDTELKNEFMKSKKGETTPDFLMNFHSFKQMLEELKLSYDDYILAIRTSIRCDTIFHKREPNAININNYNEPLLNLWQANVDLQYIVDPYAAIQYLFSYILKTDKGIIRLMSEAIKNSHETGAKQRQYLRNIANAFNNSLIIGASQAVDYICGTPLSKFSRDVIFINTNRPHNRISMKKSSLVLRQLADDDTDIFEFGINEKYEARPEKLKHVCLADFAAIYTEKKSNKNQEKEFTERKNKRIIRYVGYKKEKNEMEFYREQLMLYLPWNNEQNELVDLEMADLKSKYEENKEKIQKKYNEYNKINEAELEALKVQFLNEEMEKDESDDRQEGFYQMRKEINEDFEDFMNHDAFGSIKDSDHTITTSTKKGKKKTDDSNEGNSGYTLTLPPRVPDEEIEKILKLLNTDQRRIVYSIYEAFQTGIKDQKIFLTGTAGTGKSFVINSIYQLMTNYFDRLTENPDDKDSVKVLLTAPTGISAYLIGGNTIHHTFRLPINGRNISMSDSVSNTIYSQLKHVEIIIIDECSFISNRDFALIDQRLKQIFNTHEPFGGKCVLLVGDLCQLPPVKGKPIYTSFVESKGEKATLDDVYKDDVLWGKFKMYQLKEVKRQKDAQYIKILTELIEGGLKDEGFKCLENRHFTRDKIPIDAIILTWTNEDVKKFNEESMKRVSGVEYVSTADDKPVIVNKNDRGREQEIIDEFTNDSNSSLRIPYRIIFKKSLKYMISHNIDVSQGLVNGAYGVLEKLTLDATTNEPIIAWIRFMDNTIGKRQIEKFKDHPHYVKGCVPLLREKIEMVKVDKVGREQKPYRIVRDQFFMMMCEALTIHKSQGQTFKKVAINVTGICQRRELLFVALSRADYDGIFLFGILEKPGKKQKNPLKKKPQTDDQDGNNDDDYFEVPNAIKELRRLERDASFQLPFDTLEKKEEDSVVVIYQNINGYKNKAEFIIADAWYKNGDILIFSEANVSTVQSYPDCYEVVFPKAEDHYHSKKNRGLIILAKPNTIDCLSKVNIIEFEKGHLDLRTFVVNNHFFIVGYKSPQVSIDNFRKELKLKIEDAPKDMDITIMGDFNLEAGKKEHKFQNQILEKLQGKDFFNQLSPEHTTTKHGTQIDVIFSTSNKGIGGTYPSPYNLSDHKVIYYKTKASEHETHYIFFPKAQDTNIEKEENQKSLQDTVKIHEIEYNENVLVQKVSAMSIDELNSSCESIDKYESESEIALSHDIFFTKTVDIKIEKKENQKSLDDDIKMHEVECNVENILIQKKSDMSIDELNSTCESIDKYESESENALSQKISQMSKEMADEKREFKYALFENSIAINEIVQTDSGDQMETQVTYANLCAFNAIIHGFIALYKEDICFHEYVEETSNVCEFFRILKEIIEFPDRRNRLWIEYIKEMNRNVLINKKNTVNKKSMFYNSNEALTNFLSTDFVSFTRRRICTSCKKESNYESCPVMELLNNNLKITSEHDLVDEIEKTTQLIQFDEVCDCNVSKVVYENNFKQLLILAINGEHIKKCNINDFPSTISLSNRSFKLLMIVHDNLAHFNTFVDINNRFLYIDDAKQGKREEIFADKLQIEANSKNKILIHERVNVKIMVYFEVSSAKQIEKFEAFKNQLENDFCEFINMSCINSNAKGFIACMKISSSLEEFIINETKKNASDDFFLFNVICDILKLNDRTSQEERWMKFVSIFAPLNFEENSAKKQIVDLSLSVQQFYRNIRLLGTFSSYNIQQTCSSCENSKIVSHKRTDCIFMTFNNNLFTSLPKNILNSVSVAANLVCEKSQCKGEVNVKIFFDKLVLILTSDSEVYANFNNLQLCDIPCEILLPSAEGAQNFYWLQFIQNLKEIPNKYTCIIKEQTKEYLEYDDDFTGKSLSSHYQVNPQFIAYFQHNEETLVKPIFRNSFAAFIKLDQKSEPIKVSVNNMCCFNSFINPFLRMLYTNKSCFDFCESNQNVRFFNLLIQIYQTNSQQEKNNLWIQFIFDNSHAHNKKIKAAKNKKRSQCAGMETTPDTVLDVAFNEKDTEYSYCRVTNTCSKCNHVSENELMQHSVFINVTANELENISDKVFENVAKIAKKKIFCDQCNNKKDNTQVIAFNKFIFVLTSRTSEKNKAKDFNQNGENEVNFNGISKILCLNGKIYNLRFFQNYVSGGWHYTSLYNIPSIDSHLEIDDIQEKIKIVSNNSYNNFNPKMILYMCND